MWSSSLDEPLSREGAFDSVLYLSFEDSDSVRAEFDQLPTMFTLPVQPRLRVVAC